MPASRKSVTRLDIRRRLTALRSSTGTQHSRPSHEVAEVSPCSLRDRDSQHRPPPPRDESAALQNALWSVDEAIYALMSCAGSSQQQTSQKTSTAMVDEKWSGHTAPATVSVQWTGELRREGFHNKGIYKGIYKSCLRALHTTCMAGTVAGYEHN